MRNNGIIDTTCMQFRKWSKYGQTGRSVICENSGENFKLEQAENRKEWKTDIKFEYIGVGMP